MARRYINTSKFNPYTYQELAAPLERATALLSQQAQNLSNVEMQNLEIGKYLDPELDKEQYEIYKNNVQNLRNASDHLLQNGLRGDIYNVMKNANIAFFQDIRPMQKAVVNRQNYYSSVNETLTNHPDFAIKGSYKKPLGEFYNGIPKTNFVSGEAIKKDVAEMSQLLASAKQVTMTPEKWSQYRELVRKQYGYTLPELEAAKQEGSYERHMMEQILRKHGVIDEQGRNLMNNEADMQKMLNYALEGLNHLLGKNDAEIVNNDLDKMNDNAYKWASLAWDKEKTMLSLSTKSGGGSGNNNGEDDDVALPSRYIYSGATVNKTAVGRKPILTLASTQDKQWGATLAGLVLAHTDPVNAVTNLNGNVKKTYDAHGNKISVTDLNNLRDAQNINIVINTNDNLPRDVAAKSPMCIRVEYTKGKQVKFLDFSPEQLGISNDIWLRFSQDPVMKKLQTNPHSLNMEEQRLAYEMQEDMLKAIRNSANKTFKTETLN